MNRKVFISVLGASRYQSCRYATDDFISEELCYVQIATLKYLNAQAWGNDSRSLFLLTDYARKINWVDTTEYGSGCKKGLKSELEQLQLPFSVEELSIPDGQNEQEIWQLFDLLYKQIQEGDLLYFDVTHGFRYLPMLVLVFGNYVKLLKNAKVVSITYGNFEGRDKTRNVAPIVDLLSLSSLQDWTSASISFLRNGNSSMLYELSRQPLHQRLKNPETRDDATKNLNELIKNIHQEIENRQTCRGLEMISLNQINKINKLFAQLDTTFIYALNPVLNKLKTQFEIYNEENGVDAIFKTAQWCYDNGLYQQAVTLFHENIITHVCMQIDSCQWQNLEHRKAISSAFTIKNKSIPPEEWILSSNSVEGSEKQKSLIKCALKLKQLEDLHRSFTSLSDLRNDFNHSGIRPDNARKSASIKKQLKDLILEVSNILGQNDQNSQYLLTEAKAPKLLINLSNHPYEKWDLKQKEASKIFGSCVNLQFPAVDEEADEEDIKALCAVVLEQVNNLISKHSAPDTTSIHVMGEHTLTFALVRCFQDLGFNCIASTSKRLSSEMQGNKKLTQFAFGQFRAYPII